MYRSEISEFRQMRFHICCLLDVDSYYCLFCAEEVTALLCDGCNRWQHRRCQTGITREQYKEVVRSGVEVLWQCLYCSARSTPIAESTILSYKNMDTFDIPASFEIENEQSGMRTFSIFTFAIHHNGCFYARAVY